MAVVISLDTHAVVKELQAAGFTEAQAEAVTRAVRRGQDLDLSHLATKADLAELRSELKAEIADLRSALKAEIAEVRSESRAELAALRSELKAEIADLRSELKAEIAELRLSTRAGFAELKSDLLKWVIGLVGLQTLTVIGAVLALTRLMAR